jgi:hypothetical protein
LFVVCCLLFVVCCLLFVICCLISYLFSQKGGRREKKEKREAEREPKHTYIGTLLVLC